MRACVGVLIAIAIAACSNVDFSGTRFQCNDDEPCPSGLECIANVCSNSADVPDADPNAPDAPDATTDSCGTDPTPILSFSDDFDDDALDSRWTPNTSSGATVAESNGRLVITMVSAPPNNSGQIETNDPSFDLTGHRTFVEIPQMVSGDARAVFRLFRGDDNHVLIEQQGGTLSFERRNQNGTAVNGTAAYDAVQDRWWQFRESGGQLFAETSPDGQTWTAFGQRNTPGFTSNIQIELSADTSGEATPGTFELDNLNVCP